MKSILKNFINALARFKTAMLLNILGLSVAYAAFMLIIMQVNYDYKFDTFHKDNDHIYRLEIDPSGVRQTLISRPMADIIASLPQVEIMGLRRGWNEMALFSVEKNGVKVSFREGMVGVYPSYMEIFHFEMLEGKISSLEEPNNVLFPETMFKKIWGNESITGKTINLGDRQLIIGGIYKDFPKNSSVTNEIYRAIDKDENLNHWGNWSYNVYIKINPAENIDHVLQIAENKLKEANANGDLNKQKLLYTPFRDLHFTSNIAFDNGQKVSYQTVAVLFALAFIILIIASVNYTNFSMALAPIRIRSINTRKVLGASDSEIRISLLSEAVLVNIGAFLLSILWVYMASHIYIATLVDADLSLLSNSGIIGMTFAITAIAGILAGLYPALYVTSFTPAFVLRGSFGLSPKGRKTRSILICIQYVASLVLVMCASFMYLQNRYMHNVKTGYDKDQLITTRLSPAIQQNRDVFTNELKMFSGIEDVTYAQYLLSTSDEYMSWGMGYRGGSIHFQSLPVSPSFLDVVGIKVEEGRNFREEDLENKFGKFIFNETARKQFGLELNSYVADSMEIIGFIPDIQYRTLRSTSGSLDPQAFVVVGNWGFDLGVAYIKVKAGSDMHAAMDVIKSTFRKIDSEYPVEVRFYDGVLNDVYQKETRLTKLITLFSIVAIVISIIGVFGLVVFENVYRRKEISLRKVLGSSIKEVLALFNKTYFVILFICFLVSCPIAYYIIDKWLENFTYRTPIYWWVFLCSGILVFIITVITVTWQSWRSATANPVDALKTE